LSHMKRGYTAEDFIREVEEIRKKFPLANISTDIIVGYPTETYNDFKKTVEVIQLTRPDIINISKFSSRPGTEAHKLKQLPPSEIKKRSVELHKLKLKISAENNKKWHGWEGDVLIDEKNNLGRNIYYKPIVAKSNKNLFGKIVKVKVIETRSNFLLGKLIE